MSDLKIQGVVEMSSEGAERALDRVGNKAGQMAANMQQAGERAGKAVEQIGEIAKSNGEKFTRSESAIVASIKRATLEAAKSHQALEKLGDIEFNIAAKGLDPAKFQSMLDVTRRVAAETKAAAGAINNAAIPSFDKMGISAKQTAAAMRQVPQQFSDIVISLQAGQAPMTVLLQQGSQLKDLFGGIGPAARALGGYVAGMVNPVTIGAAALSGLGYAAYLGNQEFKALHNTLRMTGGYTGLTVKQIDDMADRLAGFAGGAGTAREAIRQLIATGRVGGDQLEDFGRAAIQLMKGTGVGIEDAAKSIADLGEDAVKWAEKHNQQYHFMSRSQYELAKQYADTGDKAGAAKVVVDALANSQKRMAEDGAEDVGSLVRWYNEWGVVLDKIANGLKAVGRPDTNFAKINSALEQREVLEWELAAAQQGRDVERQKYVQRQLDDNLKLINSLRSVGEEERKRAAQSKADAEESARAFGLGAYIGDSKRMTPAGQLRKQIEEETKAFNIAVKGFAQDSKEYQDALRAHNVAVASIRESFAKKNADPANTDIANIKARIQAEQQYLAQLTLRGAEADKLNEGEKLALQYAEQLKGKLDAKTKARAEELLVQAKSLGATQKEIAAIQEMLKRQDEFTKLRDKEEASIRDSIKGINDRAQAVEDEIATYGMGKDALEAMAIARLEEKRAALIQFDGSDERIRQLDEEIEARKRLAAAMASKDVLDTNAKAAKTAAEEWRRSFERIEDWIGDAIGRGVTKGKDIFQGLIDGLKTAFARLVLSPIIRPIAAAGAMMLNPGAAQAAGGDGFGGAANMFSAGRSLYEGFSTGFASMGNTVASYVQQGMNAWAGTGSVTTGASMSSAGWVSAEGGAGYLSSGASGVGVGASYLAGAAVGVYGGRALSNGYSAMGGGSGNTAVNVGTAIGALWGPIGAAIGGLIGGLVNRAFGRKLTDMGVEGNVTGGEFNGSSFQHMSGGWFRSDKVKRSPIDDATVDVFANAVGMLKDEFDEMSVAIGGGASLLNDFSYQFKLSLKGLNPQEMQAAFTRQVSEMNDAMAVAFVDNFRKTIRVVEEQWQEVFAGIHFDDMGNELPSMIRISVEKAIQGGALSTSLDPYIDDMVRIFDSFRDSVKGVEGAEGQVANFTKQLFALGDAFVENGGFASKFGEALDFDKLEAMATYGEDVFATFTRLTNVFTATNAVAAMVGKTAESAFGTVGLASTDARQRLISLAGGIDALGAGAAFFAENFLTEADRLKPVSDMVAGVFSQFGIAGDTTKEQFANIVKGALDGTEAGEKLYVALTNIAPAFLQLTNHMDAAAEKIKELANTAFGMDLEIMRRTGRVGEAIQYGRDRELANLDPSLRGRQQALWQLEDEQSMFDMDLDIMRRTGRETEALAASRERELALMDPLLHARQRFLWQLEDEQAAIERAMADVSTAFSGVQRAVEAERTAATTAYNGAVSSFNERIQAVTGSISKLTGLSNSLRSTIDRMRLPSDLATDRASAQAQIQAALAIARAGGVLPDADALRNALDVVSQPSEQLYASLVDFQRQYLTDKNAITELAGLTDAQLTVEERMLKSVQDQLKATEEGYRAEMQRLDNVLTYAQQQIDILNGIDTGIDSVAAAIANLQIKISAAAGAQAGAGNTGGTTSNPVTGLYQNILGRAPDAEGAAWWQNAIANDSRPFDAIVRDFVSGAVTGGTAEDEERARAWARANGIPGFAVGTNYVPRDMLAMIHEGEAIVPKAYNPAANASALRSGDNELKEEVRALRIQVAALLQDISAETRATAQFSNRTAKVLERVAPDGDALAIREATV